MRRIRPVAWLMAALVCAAVVAAVLLVRARWSASSVGRPPQAAGENAPRRVFHSPLAGTWYEADKKVLARQIAGYLNKAQVERLDHVCALVLPHAGYRWSGQTAAYGIKQVVGRAYRRVIILGPSHRLPMLNVVSVPDATHYATPLGEVPLDQLLLKQLRSYSVVQSIAQAHNGEHSVQIEIPLLQQALGPFQLVPIVVGQLDRPTIRRVARILRGLIDEQSLVVASSDFTHYGLNYGYFPFRENVAENLKKLDTGSWDRIRKKDLDGFFKYINKTGTTICGRNAIGILLAMLPDESKAHQLDYATSGQLTGDYTSSVSYMSIAFTGKWPKGKPVQADSGHAGLSDQDKQRLLKLARATLAYALEKREVPSVEQLDVSVTPAMKQIAGAFVTLHKHGRLRGCVGEILPMRPVYQAVMAQAINAGLNDRRFPPVQASELSELDFEVSVLTPPEPVPSADQIVLGKHGVILDKGGRRAVFLPQVAVEQGWGLEEMLTELSLKAGLPADAWKQGASLSVFEAVVFGEEDR